MPALLVGIAVADEVRIYNARRSIRVKILKNLRVIGSLQYLSTIQALQSLTETRKLQGLHTKWIS